MISQKDLPQFKDKQRILLQANEYLYILPHPSLKMYVANYTFTFPTKWNMSEHYTIMPCGSATLVIETDTQKLNTILFGPATKPFTVGYNPSEMLVIVEFQPAGLHALTGIPQNEMTDIVLPFDAVNSDLCKLFQEAVEKTDSVHKLAETLDGLFLKNLYTTFNPHLQRAFHNIIKSAGNTTLKGLSTDIHYSERQLSRIFSQSVGTSAKAFSRMVRLIHVCRLLENDNNSITDISNALGYYDLQHLNHDFKSISGVTPKEYRKNMADFYHAIAKF
jgi:AraC-like DNA-binding protein